MLTKGSSKKVKSSLIKLAALSTLMRAEEENKLSASAAEKAAAAAAPKRIFLHFSPSLSLPLVHYLICALCLRPESSFALSSHS